MLPLQDLLAAVARVCAGRNETVTSGGLLEGDAPEKQTQWKAFVTRTSTTDRALDLSKAVEQVRVFLIPVLEGLTRATPSAQKWIPGYRMDDRIIAVDLFRTAPSTAETPGRYSVQSLNPLPNLVPAPFRKAPSLASAMSRAPCPVDEYPRRPGGSLEEAALSGEDETQYYIAAFSLSTGPSCLFRSPT